MSVNNLLPSKLLVIGGDSSLGSAIIVLAKIQGFDVTATTRRQITKKCETVQWLLLDIENASSVEGFINTLAESRFERIIYCLGELSNIANFDESQDAYQKYFNIYFATSAFIMMKMVASLDSSQPSQLIYISSRSAIYPSFDFLYAAVKSGLTSFITSLAKRLEYPMSALSVAPGLIIDSSMYKKMAKDIQDSHHYRSGNRLLSLEDAARLILNIDCEQSIRHSGQIIEIGPSYE